MADKLQKSPVEESFTENESALKRFLERFIYSAHDVEDILQETFLQTWSIEKKQKIQAPRAYLFRVARNMALKELRKRSGQITAYMEEVDRDNLIGSDAPTENEVELNERLILFEKALSTLSPRCRKVFILRKVFGFSQKEIARRMNISVSTVEKHIINGLQRCNVYMNAHGIDDPLVPGKRNTPETTMDRLKEAK